VGRVLYISHDDPRPSGGVRTLYAHVRHLCRNGIPAFLVHHDPAFQPTWFGEAVPTLSFKHGIEFRPDDLVLIPEDFHAVLEWLKDVPVTKAVFCQNHFYVYHGLRDYPSWGALGVRHVLASSTVIAEFLQTVLGLAQVSVVPYAIDLDLFRPGPKKRQIAYMPRKLPTQANFVRRLTTAFVGDAVAWVPIDGATETETAAILAESAIFLSLSHLEGFGLPPVEAMASGCLVVGYHGFGGKEYATADNGIWCEEGNPIACAQALRQAVARLDDTQTVRMIEHGRATAAQYTFERQERELLCWIRGLQAAAG
jgi:glycosyltransferase involved in cell wall biosynthesis